MNSKLTQFVKDPELLKEIEKHKQIKLRKMDYRKLFMNVNIFCCLPKICFKRKEKLNKLYNDGLERLN